MYVLLQLIGIAAAMIGEQWLRSPRSWHAWAIAGLVLIAVLDHVSGFLLAGGLFALAGLRRDAFVWRWRLAVTGAAALWLPLWGPSFLEQRHLRWSSWMPRTTLGGIAQTVSRQLVFVEGVAPFVLLAVIVGGVCLVRRDNTLGRLWIACGVLPFAAASVIGIFEGFLFDRTLSVAAWAPPLADRVPRGRGVPALAYGSARRSRSVPCSWPSPIRPRSSRSSSGTTTCRSSGSSRSRSPATSSRYDPSVREARELEDRRTRRPAGGADEGRGHPGVIRVCASATVFRRGGCGC